jgi:hypothetical protein
MQAKITIKEVKAGETQGSSHPNMRYAAKLIEEDIGIVLSFTDLSESVIKPRQKNVLLHYRPSLAGERTGCHLPHMMQSADENYSVGSTSRLTICIISHPQNEHTDEFIKDEVSRAIASIEPKPFFIKDNRTINLEKVSITLAKFDAFELDANGKPVALVNRLLQDFTNKENDAKPQETQSLWRKVRGLVK